MNGGVDTWMAGSGDQWGVGGMDGWMSGRMDEFGQQRIGERMFRGSVEGCFRSLLGSLAALWEGFGASCRASLAVYWGLLRLPWTYLDLGKLLGSLTTSRATGGGVSVVVSERIWISSFGFNITSSPIEFPCVAPNSYEIRSIKVQEHRSTENKQENQKARNT
jgi:hypothetical protein